MSRFCLKDLLDVSTEQKLLSHSMEVHCQCGKLAYAPGVCVGVMHRAQTESDLAGGRVLLHNGSAGRVTRIENGADAKQSTMDRLQHALEAAGIEFIQENGGGPGVRLGKRHQKKS
jgi:IMP dehydrogenase/GMP reductase